MLKVSMTYSEITPESAEQGTFSDTGFVWQDAELTFRELVHYLHDHRNASCWPATGAPYEWYVSDAIYDYHTGEERTTSLHFEHSNPAYKAKYWRKAAVAAGIVRVSNVRN